MSKNSIRVYDSRKATQSGFWIHEVAHIATRHATEQASKGELVNFATPITRRL